MHRTECRHGSRCAEYLDLVGDNYSRRIVCAIEARKVLLDPGDEVRVERRRVDLHTEGSHQVDYAKVNGDHDGQEGRLARKAVPLDTSLRLAGVKTINGPLCNGDFKVQLDTASFTMTRIKG